MPSCEDDVTAVVRMPAEAIRLVIGCKPCSACAEQACGFQAMLTKGKGSPYSITDRRVPVLGSQHAGDLSHKPGGRLPLLSARPAVTPATLKTAAANFAAW